jgi:hypothetical protein
MPACCFHLLCRCLPIAFRPGACSRPDAPIERVMKEGALDRRTQRGSGRDSLVIQVALAEMLLIGAGLLLAVFY